MMLKLFVTLSSDVGLQGISGDVPSKFITSLGQKRGINHGAIGFYTSPIYCLRYNTILLHLTAKSGPSETIADFYEKSFAFHFPDEFIFPTRDAAIHLSLRKIKIQT